MRCSSTSSGSEPSRRTANEIHPLSDIVGRAVILHEGLDNHGNIPVGTAANQYTPNSPDATTLTHNTGNAVSRIACGLIR